MTKIKFLFASIMILLTLNVSAQDKISQPYIEVTSNIERKIVPDNIYLSLIIKEVKNRTIDQIELDVIKALKKAGIPEDRLSLQDAASDMINIWYKKNSIEAQKQYQLLLHTTNEIGDVMNSLDFPGIENLSIAYTEYSKEEELKMELAAEALGKAKQKANTMLKAIDKKVDQPLIVREERIYVPRTRQTLQGKIMNESMVSLDEYKRPEISFNKETYTYEVFVRFSIEQ